MSMSNVVLVLFYFFSIALLTYGIMHEEKLVAFEANLKRIIVGNIRRAIRIRNQKKAIANGQHLHEVKTTKTVANNNTFVA